MQVYVIEFICFGLLFQPNYVDEFIRWTVKLSDPNWNLNSYFNTTIKISSLHLNWISRYSTWHRYYFFKTIHASVFAYLHCAIVIAMSLLSRKLNLQRINIKIQWQKQKNNGWNSMKITRRFDWWQKNVCAQYFKQMN